MPFWLIRTTSTKERHLNLFKTAPTKPNSLGFKWLHWNISFSIHFQTWAINHPCEHNGLRLWQFIIWIMSPGQVCVNLCLKLGLKLAGIFPFICTPRTVAPLDQMHPQGRREPCHSFLSYRQTNGSEESQALPASCCLRMPPQMECLLKSNERGNTQFPPPPPLCTCVCGWMSEHPCSHVHKDQRITSGLLLQPLPTLFSFKGGFIIFFLCINVWPTVSMSAHHTHP